MEDPGSLPGWDHTLALPVPSCLPLKLCVREGFLYAEVRAGPGRVSHSWGLTVPPKLVHHEPQDSRALGQATGMQKTDTHGTRMHKDTQVHGGREACHAVPLTDWPSSRQAPNTLNQTGRVSPGRCGQGRRWGTRVGGQGAGVHPELHEPLPGKGAEPWGFSWEPGQSVAGAPPHPALESNTMGSQCDHWFRLVALGAGVYPVRPRARGTGGCNRDMQI